MRERTESKSLTELEATLKQLTNQLRQSQASLAKITDQNLALEAKNAELESLRDKLAKSADRTSDKLSNLEREYDEDMTDQEEHWKFRFTELQFELEELRQTKQQ
jgi:chromosome segregation ATPase